MDYNVYKAIHTIAVLAWSAGLLYIGRLFVNYVETNHTETKSTLAAMAHRLNRYIILPSSLIAILIGLHMTTTIDSFLQGWFHLKLTLIFAILGYQHIAAKYTKQCKEGTFKKSSKWCRVFNEIVTILITGIVFAVVTKSIPTTLIAMGILSIFIGTFFILKKTS